VGSEVHLRCCAAVFCLSVHYTTCLSLMLKHPVRENWKGKERLLVSGLLGAGDKAGPRRKRSRFRESTLHERKHVTPSHIHTHTHVNIYETGCGGKCRGEVPYFRHFIALDCNLVLRKPFCPKLSSVQKFYLTIHFQVMSSTLSRLSNSLLLSLFLSFFTPCI
jgi:hypothetical protein